MNKTKENAGVTLVALIITMIVMIIIAGTSIYIGINDIDNSQDSMAKAELEEVKNIIGQRYLNYIKTKNKAYFAGTKLSSSEVSAVESKIGRLLIPIPNTFDEDERAYYRLTPNDLVTIGIEDSLNTYVVNYITGETINITKTKTNGDELLYTYIRSSFDDNEITSFKEPMNEITIEQERQKFNSL
ncbi:MAG: hypothetical protein IKP28_00975 [Clostridia bacterium]|nr:hypothetical protein [Clostridia bacterium]